MNSIVLFLMLANLVPETEQLGVDEWCASWVTLRERNGVDLVKKMFAAFTVRFPIDQINVPPAGVGAEAEAEAEAEATAT